MSKELDALKETIVVAILAEMVIHPEQHDIRVFIDQPANELYGYHLSLGRDIRHNYDLWGNVVLTNNYKHPDDFSMEIIREVHKRAVIAFRRSLVGLK